MFWDFNFISVERKTLKERRKGREGKGGREGGREKEKELMQRVKRDICPPHTPSFKQADELHARPYL